MLVRLDTRSVNISGSAITVRAVVVPGRGERGLKGNWVYYVLKRELLSDDLSECGGYCGALLTCEVNLG